MNVGIKVSLNVVCLRVAIMCRGFCGDKAGARDPAPPNHYLFGPTPTERPKEFSMPDCLHCDIHELLDSELQGKEANLAEIAAKVTEVLADIILMVPPDEQSTIMADILANLGSFILEKKEDADPAKPRRSSH
jgi:hypothetical protein